MPGQIALAFFIGNTAMTSKTKTRRYPACRPANPGSCAQCSLSYSCNSSAAEGTTVSWPLMAFMLIAMATAISSVLV